MQPNFVCSQFQEEIMANYSSISHILGAAILSVSATFILAAPVYATVNADVREAGQMISESGTRFISKEQSTLTFFEDMNSVQATKDTLVRVSANSARQLKNQGMRRMLVPQQQATSNQNGAGSLSNGTTQQPLLAPAGDEMKKIIKNLPKPNCGGPQNIC
jgi:hypothetical protein